MIEYLKALFTDMEFFNERAEDFFAFVLLAFTLVFLFIFLLILVIK